MTLFTTVSTKSPFTMCILARLVQVKGWATRKEGWSGNKLKARNTQHPKIFLIEIDFIKNQDSFPSRLSDGD
jgi:hypothetical protein